MRDCNCDVHGKESSQETKYRVFRKTFHVPKKWESDEKFQKLFEHRYLASDGMDAFALVGMTLGENGYLEDNDRMIHDYLHYMISDLLTFEGTPFITEDDIRAQHALGALFSGLTPDLIVKSEKPRRRTTIIDIYIGRGDQAAIDKKKSKYESMGVSFDFVIVTELGMCSDLKNILSEGSINYLASNFHIFKVEYQYWKSPAKLQRILRNEVDNVPLKRLDCDAVSSTESKSSFLNAFVAKAEMLMFDDGL